MYGLRISPRLWGKERDLQLQKMQFQIKHNKLRAVQSSIDVALWVIVDLTDELFDHKRKTYGYVLTYVDDFLLVGPSHVRKAIEEEISRFWKIRIEGEAKQYDKQNLEASLTFFDGYSLASYTWRFHNEPRSVCARCIEDVGDD